MRWAALHEKLLLRQYIASYFSLRFTLSDVSAIDVQLSKGFSEVKLECELRKRNPLFKKCGKKLERTSLSSTVADLLIITEDLSLTLERSSWRPFNSIIRTSHCPMCFLGRWTWHTFGLRKFPNYMLDADSLFFIYVKFKVVWIDFCYYILNNTSSVSCELFCSFFCTFWLGR